MPDQKSVTLLKLKKELIQQLHENNYKPSTIQLYSELINQLHKYMLQENIPFYTSKVSISFYKEKIESKEISKHNKQFYKTLFRRLDDCYYGRGYVYTVPRKVLSVSDNFTHILAHILTTVEKSIIVH